MQKSISKLIFAGYTGSKNRVPNRLKIQFVELVFFKLIFQESSADQQGDSHKIYLIQFQYSHYFRLSHFQMTVVHLWMPQEMAHVTHNLNAKIRVEPKVATVLQGNQLISLQIILNHTNIELLMPKSICL